MVIVLLRDDPMVAEAESSNMRIVTLIENTTTDEQLRSEHGLSLYLEIEQRKILFDAGQTSAFADNAKKLGVDLRAVDTAVLSHGHYDHGNGFARFLAENSTACIYASHAAFEQHLNKDNRDIGLNPALKDSHRFICVDQGIDLGDGITLLCATSMACVEPIEDYGLKVCRNSMAEPDDFSHELYLLVQEEGKRICITGCAHMGIVNIISWLDPDVVVGGFHFKPVSPESEKLLDAAKAMAKTDRLYYTGHCTGEEQFSVLKHTLAHRLHSLSTGTIIHL